MGGGSVGCETADYLAPLINDLFPANRDVTILEMTPSLMTGEGGAAKSQLTQRLMRKGVKIELNSQVTKVDENTITYVKEGVEHHIDDADTLVFASRLYTTEKWKMNEQIILGTVISRQFKRCHWCSLSACKDIIKQEDTLMLKKLLEPVKAGRLTLKNRIMFPPLTTGYEERDGSIGERSLNFYERLAKGGNRLT